MKTMGGYSESEARNSIQSEHYHYRNEVIGLRAELETAMELVEDARFLIEVFQARNEIQADRQDKWLSKWHDLTPPTGKTEKGGD